MLCLVAQSCPNLCDSMDCSPPGSSVQGFSRQEYWSGLPFPLPGDLPDPGIEPWSPALAGGFFTTEPCFNLVKVKVTQSCLTLCNPTGYTVQVRILEWVAFPFSRGSSQPRDRTLVSCIGRWILYHLSHQGSPSI